jgi:hypothetical protein
VLPCEAAGDGAAAYYATADALGFLVEAVEPPSEMPAVDFTLYLAHREALAGRCVAGALDQRSAMRRDDPRFEEALR